MSNTKKKKLKDLTLKDNFMFGAVMVDEKLCKEFLELVLGFRIEKVTVSKEKSIVCCNGYKSYPCFSYSIFKNAKRKWI